jgi:hypothetical protein
MNTNLLTRTPYLRTSRKFPMEQEKLPIELENAYIEIASAVNFRTIGIFPSNKPIITGESWYTTSARQQTLRKIYSFGAIASGTELDIPLNYTDFTLLTKITASVVTNVPDYRPIPFVDPVTATNGMEILVGTVAGILQIRIILGATAPPVVSGIAVIEFLSRV